MIRYHVDVPEPWKAKASFALRLLLDHEGIVARPVHGLTKPDLVYSAVAPDDAPNQHPDHTPRGTPGDTPGDTVWLRHSAVDWDSPELRVYRLDGTTAVAATAGEENPDPLLATYFLVCGIAEQGQARNPVGVPIARSSRLWEKDVLQRPAVAEIGSRLRRQLEDALAARNQSLEIVARWPQGRRYAVLLTHDVDRPLSRPPASHYRRRVRRDLNRRDMRGVARGIAGFLKNVALRGDSGSRVEKDPQFGFSKWMWAAREMGIRSAFYVAVRDAADELAFPQDVFYDAAHPAIVTAMRTAMKHGFEVGLHASIACRGREELFEQERQKLSGLLDGADVAGVRHHYWALRADHPEATLAAHERAGFRYDSSLGMNDAFGFRRGLAVPFHPFDRSRSAELSILQVPPTAMDAGAFHYGPSSPQPAAGVAALEEHLDAVRTTGGCAVLNWHLAQARPDRLAGAGPAMLEVLAAIASADGSDVWWATPAQVASWWTDRQARVFPR